MMRLKALEDLYKRVYTDALPGRGGRVSDEGKENGMVIPLGTKFKVVPSTEPKVPGRYFRTKEQALSALSEWLSYKYENSVWGSDAKACWVYAQPGKWAGKGLFSIEEFPWAIVVDSEPIDNEYGIVTP